MGLQRDIQDMTNNLKGKMVAAGEFTKEQDMKLLDFLDNKLAYNKLLMDYQDQTSKRHCGILSVQGIT